MLAVSLNHSWTLFLPNIANNLISNNITNLVISNSVFSLLVLGTHRDNEFVDLSHGFIQSLTIIARSIFDDNRTTRKCPSWLSGHQYKFNCSKVSSSPFATVVREQKIHWSDGQKERLSSTATVDGDQGPLQSIAG